MSSIVIPQVCVFHEYAGGGGSPQREAGLSLLE
jgi:hypothetical protein